MRIGIVNDMPMAIEALRRVLASAPEHKVIWVAHDGAEAVALSAQDTPDLVLMDLIMPGMDGVEATRRIMAENPCAILIVTVSVNTHTPRVFEAMGYGALDAVDTPVLEGGEGAIGTQLLLAKIAIIAKLLGDTGRVVPETRRAADEASSKPSLIAIGASAGGPAALATVLTALPKTFDSAVIVVQHVDEKFAPGMAEWLGGHSALPVRLADEGDRAEPGIVLVAGAAGHLTFRSSNRLAYVAGPPDCVYRPSVDLFFESVSKHWRGHAVGVLLTGMGRDGAHGLKLLRSRGYHTIAQDKASSAVYGMPKAAADLGAAVEVLSIDSVAPRLADLVKTRRSM